jgi:hypothetical protein
MNEKHMSRLFSLHSWRQVKSSMADVKVIEIRRLKISRIEVIESKIHE